MPVLIRTFNERYYVRMQLLLNLVVSILKQEILEPELPFSISVFLPLLYVRKGLSNASFCEVDLQKTKDL